MGIDKKQLAEVIIKPILLQFGLYSENAEDLLLATCAQESHMGTYLVQQKGPALGIFQMEPATYNDIVINVIEPHPHYSYKMSEIFGKSILLPRWQELINNLSYATIFCRLQYWRYPEPLPFKGDIEGMYKYWKTYYNRNPSKGHFEQFKENYITYVIDE